MATKTWNGGSSTWATAASWTPSGVPATTDDVIINAGQVTVAAQTCGSLTIGGSCTIAGTSLTVTNALNLNSGTLTITATGTLTLNGNVTSAGGTISQNTTGNVTLGSATAVNVDFGPGNNFRLLTIAKTSSAQISLINNTINVTATGTNSSIFTFTSGTLIQNVVINCGGCTNTSSTARSWAMNQDLILTAGGNAIGCSMNSTTTCTFTSRTGTVRIRSLTNATANTITFPAPAVSTTAASSYTFNVALESNTNWSINGSVNNISIDGQHTGTAGTLTVYGTLTSSTGDRTFTTCSINMYNATNGQTVTQAIGYTTFSTVTINCITGTTATFTIQSLKAINITCNGASCTYNLGVQNDDAQIVTLSTNGTLILSATSGTFNLYNVRSYTTTMSSTGTYACYNYQHNGYTVTASPTAGTVTHTAGTLTIKSGYILYTWGFTSSSGTRGLTFETNSYIQTQWNGTLTVNYLSMTASCAFDDAGFYHQSTAGWNLALGTGGTVPASVNAAFNIWTYYTGGPTTGSYVRTWTVNDGTGAAGTTTVNVCKNFTGYTGTSMAGLTVAQFLAGGTVDYSGVAIAAYNNAVGSITQYVNNCTAVNYTLSGSSSTYNLGIIDVSSMTLSTTGTITLSGNTATYNLNSVRGYNVALSGTSATYNCYDYSHSYYTNPPTAGTVTHTAGTIILKSTPAGVGFRYQMATWSFTSTTGTRGITFEDGGWIQTLNTGAINVNYTSLTSSCTETDNSGFYHNGSGSWQLGPAAPSSPAAALNLIWTTRVTVGASYVKNLGNYETGDGYKIGCGLLNNTAAVSVSVSGNILFTGNAFASGQIQADTKWQWLNLTYWGADATRTCTYTTGASEFGEGGVFRAFGPLTLAATFTGTLKLYSGLAVATVTHQGGTLDVYGSQLTVTTSYSSTDGTVNKYITNTAATSASPDIYITATTGTPWSFAYSSLLYSYNNVWIYIRGGTVSHGATARQTTYQPSFDLTERVTAYTLAPTTAFQIGGLRINNYTVPTNSVWSIGGPEFTFYTGGLSAPAAFTVNIVSSGRTGEICQMYVDNNTFAWPQVNISTNTTIACGNFKFKNINIDGGTTTSSGQFVEVAGTLGSSGWFETFGTLNISNSNWVFRGATAINYVLSSIGFYMISDSTGTATFDGVNGTQQGDQYAGFATNFGGRIVNNIQYNTSTGVGTLILTAGWFTSQLLPTASQIDFNYTTSSINFYLDKPNMQLYGFPIKGSTFNVGTSSAGYRYIRIRSGNYQCYGIYNTESSSIVSGDYLNIAGAPARGGGGWYAGTHSIDGGGNTGWTFTDPPTYQLTSSTASVNEGATLTITLATTNLSNGATVAYTITGATSADLNGASLTGNFTINSGSASLVLSIANDYLTEGNETLTLALNNGAASISVTIIDTSLTRTYSLSRSDASVSEGSTFTITLTTTNVTNSTLVPYTISGTNLTTNDFAALLSGYTSRGTWSASTAYVTNDVVIYLGNMYNAIASSTNQIPSATLGTYWNSLVGSLTGNFTITNNTNAITFLTNWDYSPESTETLTLALDNGLSTVSVDIANVLNPTYALSTTALSLNEGGNFTITLTTTDVANNTLVPYTITGVSSADINGASLTGNFTVSSNTASQIFTVTADYVTEGNETFVLTLNTIGTNVSVLLIDYTKTRTYSLSTDATGTVYEGGSFTITLTTTNVFDGTLVPYTITGVTSPDINNASLTGNFTINSGVGTQSFTTTIDGISEGVEVFTLTLGSPGTGSINVSISDPVSAGGGDGLLLFD